jgi:ribosome maturation factor RimP
MAKDIATLQALLEPTVTALGYELLGCVFMPQGRRGLLRIYIDSDKGIHIADCEKVSRQISAVLDVEDPITGAYTLEVSSPGLNRPLFKLAHFQKFVGSMVNVRLHIPLGNRRQFRGLLQAVVGDKIVVRVAEEVFELPFASIARANLVVDVAAKESKQS